MAAADHPTLVRAAIRVSAASVVWAAFVGFAALGSGIASGSLALVGFGLDSVIDGSASVVLVWRFRAHRLDPARADRVEHVAHRLVGVTLLLVAAYLAAEAVAALVGGASPHVAVLGVVLAATSIVVLPVLAVVKIRLGAALPSHALRADGVLSAAGALLGSFALLGLLLDRTLGWWWSDAAAALLIAVALAREGVRALRTPPPAD